MLSMCLLSVPCYGIAVREGNSQQQNTSTPQNTSVVQRVVHRASHHGHITSVNHTIAACSREISNRKPRLKLYIFTLSAL
jgi:hypothetical protein